MFRRSALFTAALAALLPHSVNALGLGSARLLSAMNEPLKVEVALIDSQEVNPDFVMAKLVADESYDLLMPGQNLQLNKVQFSPRRTDDGSVVIDITTNSPIREPFVMFLLEVKWNKGHLLREYVITLDPAERDYVTAPDYQRFDTPVADDERPRSARTPGAKSAGGYRVRQDDVLSKIAIRLRSPGTPMPQMAIALWQENPQAFIDGDINRLIPGALLRVPDAAQIAAIPRRQATRIYYNQAVTEQSPEAPAAEPTIVAHSAQAPSSPHTREKLESELTALMRKLEDARAMLEQLSRQSLAAADASSAETRTQDSEDADTAIAQTDPALTAATPDHGADKAAVDELNPQQRAVTGVLAQQADQTPGPEPADLGILTSQRKQMENTLPAEQEAQAPSDDSLSDQGIQQTKALAADLDGDDAGVRPTVDKGLAMVQTAYPTLSSPLPLPPLASSCTQLDALWPAMESDPKAPELNLGSPTLAAPLAVDPSTLHALLTAVVEMTEQTVNADAMAANEPANAAPVRQDAPDASDATSVTEAERNPVVADLQPIDIEPIRFTANTASPPPEQPHATQPAKLNEPDIADAIRIASIEPAPPERLLANDPTLIDKLGDLAPSRTALGLIPLLLIGFGLVRIRKISGKPEPAPAQPLLLPQRQELPKQPEPDRENLAAKTEISLSDEKQFDSENSATLVTADEVMQCIEQRLSLEDLQIELPTDQQAKAPV